MINLMQPWPMPMLTRPHEDAAHDVSFDIVHGVQPSSNPKLDWGRADALRAGLLEDTGLGLPGCVDLRVGCAWWGSRAAEPGLGHWAAVESVLRWHLVKNCRLSGDDALCIEFMRQQAGGADLMKRLSLKGLLDIVRKRGCLPGRNPPLTPASANALAAQRRIACYFNLIESHSQSTLASLRRWLADVGPVVAVLNTDQTWINASATGGLLGGYLSHTTIEREAVALVGYTRNGFLIRTHRGPSWGNDGHVQVNDAYLAASICEAFGLCM